MPSLLEAFDAATRATIVANTAAFAGNVLGTRIPARMARGYMIVNLASFPVFLCDDAGDIDVIDARSWSVGPLLQGTNYLYARYDQAFGTSPAGTSYGANKSSRVWIRPLEKETTFNRGVV